MVAQVWSGSLTFGLVNLPVSLVSAVRPGLASLRMLHADDGEPLEQRMHCPRCDEDVPPSEQIRGFPVESGEYVHVSDDELESLASERSRAIEIDRFVDVGEIEPVYYDRPYFLLPDEGAEKPYWLLVNALAECARAGIAKLVLSAREHLVAVMAQDDVLRLHTLRFDRQVVDAGEFEPEASDFSDDEGLDNLVDYIDERTAKFDSGDYVDWNDLRLLEFIRDQAEQRGVKRSSLSRRKRALSRSRAVDRIDAAIDELDV